MKPVEAKAIQNANYISHRYGYKM